MASVIRGADNFDSGVNGRVLQVHRHAWTTNTTNTSNAYTQATGSGFNFTPKSATSKFIVTLDLATEVISGTASVANGIEAAIRADSIYQGVQGNGHRFYHYTGAPAATPTAMYTPYYLSVEIPPRGNVTQFLIDVGFRLYSVATGASTTINLGNFESSITVTEVEA